MLDLTGGQMAELRLLLAVPDGEPDPTGADVIAVLKAQAVVDAASIAWHNLEEHQ